MVSCVAGSLCLVYGVVCVRVAVCVRFAMCAAEIIGRSMWVCPCCVACAHRWFVVLAHYVFRWFVWVTSARTGITPFFLFCVLRSAFGLQLPQGFGFVVCTGGVAFSTWLVLLCPVDAVLLVGL